MATNHWENCCSSNKLCSVPSAILSPISFINGMWCYGRSYATRHIWFQIWAFTSGKRTKASASKVPHAQSGVISSQRFHCLIINCGAVRGWVEGKTPLCHSLCAHSFQLLQTKTMLYAEMLVADLSLTVDAVFPSQNASWMTLLLRKITAAMFHFEKGHKISTKNNLAQLYKTKALTQIHLLSFLNGWCIKRSPVSAVTPVCTQSSIVHFLY